MASMTYGEGVNLTEQMADATADWDEISVKDVIDLSPKPTSKSGRYAFETFGFAIQRFVKMPGHHCYELHVRRRNAQAFQGYNDVLQRVTEILNCAGLQPAKG